MENPHVFRRAAVIDNLSADLQQRRILFRINTVCGAADTEMVKVDFICTHQVNVPVNPGAAVPAGVGNQIVFHAHGHQVFAFPHQLRYIHIKGGVAVAVAACFLSVYIDCGIHIDALKIQVYLFLFRRTFHRKMLSVPADAGFCIPASAACLFIFLRGIIHAPVMGEV